VEAKNLLLHKLTVDRTGVELLGGQNYSQWAITARKEIKQMISERHVSDEAKQMSSEKLIQLLVNQQAQIDKLQQQIVDDGVERNTKHREVMEAISKQTLAVSVIILFFYDAAGCDDQRPTTVLTKPPLGRSIFFSWGTVCSSTSSTSTSIAWATTNNHNNSC
jgi:hypothetical protein